MLKRHLTARLLRPHVARRQLSLPIRRLNSTHSKPPAEWAPKFPVLANEAAYANHAVWTLNFFKRLIGFSILGVTVIGFTTATAFEATHMYVENVGMAPETDPEARKWGWDLELERWSGGNTGGTNSALGFGARHLIRGAWMALNWGTGSDNAVIAPGGKGAGGLSVVESRLNFARNLLKSSIVIAEEKLLEGKIEPHAFLELIARHANTLERMGTPTTLFESRADYERIWAGTSPKGVESARIALKLGDLNSRLGDLEDATSWWGRAYQLSEGLPPSENIYPIPLKAQPHSPTSPASQRIFASMSVSLSAFLATSGNLKAACDLQKTALERLSSHLSLNTPKTGPPSSLSPPANLHSLYLRHRRSLISIHHSEVLFALKHPLSESIHYLQSAAQASEEVALALTGLPRVHPDAPTSTIPHPPSTESPLLDTYTKSPSMCKPATGLLRDARRTAAEAWSLLGLLTEEAEKGKPEKALECYERALGWAGVKAEKYGGIGEPSERTLESDWMVLWKNYVRIRAAVAKGTNT